MKIHNTTLYFYVSILLILCKVTIVSSEEKEEKKKEKDAVCKDPTSCDVRIVTKEELAQYKGENDGDLWLSILGEVYDVTHGEGRGYYGGGPKGYGIFAGQDCSIAYTTGKFTQEECDNASYDDIKVTQVKELFNWKKFYEDHEIYEFVGLLHDVRYFDEKGHKTEHYKQLEERIATYDAAKKAGTATADANAAPNDKTSTKNKKRGCDMKTKENCSDSEKSYIHKITTKATYKDRKQELKRLEGILAKDPDANSALSNSAIEWIQIRIRYIRELIKVDESKQSQKDDL